MKIIVTGGCGFIGNAVVKTFLKLNNVSLINLDKLTYASNSSSLNEIKNNKNYFFERVDICDRKKLKKIFHKYNPDGVIHLAAETHVDRSIDTSNDFINTNILGTHNLLENSRDHFKKKKKFKFLHVSTDEVYGDLNKKNSGFTEKNKYSPSSPYSASKASADHLVRSWFRTYKLPILISNCSNNYGSYQFPEKFIPHIILNALMGKNIPVYGNGLQSRDWLHVYDHAEALKKIFFRGKIGETYNVGTGVSTTNLKLVKLICNILNEKVKSKPKNVHDFKKLISFVKDRPGHDIKYLINPKKIKKNLKWKPNKNLNKGIKQTVEWYLSNEKWWKLILKNNYNLGRLGKHD